MMSLRGCHIQCDGLLWRRPWSIPYFTVTLRNMCYSLSYIQSVTGPHRQNDRDDRPCIEDHFLWRNMYTQTCRLWVMRSWRCSPVRVWIKYRQLYTYHFIEKGMFLQYVFKQSALCLIAGLISSQQGSANKAEQQVLLVQSTVVVAPKEKKSRGVKAGATYCYDRVRVDGTNYYIICIH